MSETELHGREGGGGRNRTERTWDSRKERVGMRGFQGRVDSLSSSRSLILNLAVAIDSGSVDTFCSGSFLREKEREKECVGLRVFRVKRHLLTPFLAFSLLLPTFYLHSSFDTLSVIAFRHSRLSQMTCF